MSQQPKNSGFINKDLEDYLNKSLDEAYNVGVDCALVEIYEKKRIYESIHRAHRQLPMLELFFDEIIVKLNNLKKP